MKARPTDELRVGRTGPSWTDIHDWVALSGISPPAIALYNFLRMHVNRSRGDDAAWPGKERLALMMQKARGDGIDDPMRELVALGAVEIERVKTVPARNIYTVHALPPDGYAGPLNLGEWAERNDALVEARKTAAANRTRRSRAGTAPTEPVTNAQVTPVTVSGRLLADPTPVTAPERLLVTAPRRSEPNEVEPDEVTPLAPILQPPALPVVPVQKGGDSTTDYDRLTEAVGAARKARGWSTSAITKAARAALDDGRTIEQVIVVLARMVSDPETRTPARMAHVPGDWWQIQATTARPEWCGSADCDQTSRRRVHHETKADLGRCPVCHPLAVPAPAA